MPVPAVKLAATGAAPVEPMSNCPSVALAVVIVIVRVAAELFVTVLNL